MNEKKSITKRISFSLIVVFLLVFSSYFVGSKNVSSTNTTVISNVVDKTDTRFKQSKILQDVSIPYVAENVSNVVIDGVVSIDEYQNPFSANIDITAYWEYNDDNLTIAIVSEGLGFIAMGFGNEMDGANMIIGGEFTNNGSDYCFDATGDSWTDGPPYIIKDSIDNILLCSASEDTSTTTIEFVIPMDSGDLSDPVLATNTTQSFFFAFHADNDNIFDPSLANHPPLEMPHSIVYEMYFRPNTQTLSTKLTIDFPSEIEQGDNLTLSATLLDQNDNPLNQMNINFFRETSFGVVIIGTTLTGSEGIAVFNYSNSELIGEIVFGAVFNDFSGKIGNIDTFFLKSEQTGVINVISTEMNEPEVRDIFFIPLNQNAGQIFFLLLLRDFLFYAALGSIYILYFYSILTIIRLRFLKGNTQQISKSNDFTEDD